MSFGHALKKFREGRRLTLREFGKLCGIDHTYIHRLETEERNSPSEETVESLVRTLKLDGRRARMLRILAGQKASEQLVEVFLEDEERPLEVLEPLLHMSFRGKRPNTLDDWRQKADMLQRLMNDE